MKKLTGKGKRGAADGQSKKERVEGSYWESWWLPGPGANWHEVHEGT